MDFIKIMRYAGSDQESFNFFYDEHKGVWPSGHIEYKKQPFRQQGDGSLVKHCKDSRHHIPV